MPRLRGSRPLGAPAPPPALIETCEAAGLAPFSPRRFNKERPSASRVASVATASRRRPRAGEGAGAPSVGRRAVALVLLLAVGGAVSAGAEQTGLGSEPTAEELGAAGYTVFPDGKGLPEGRGTVSEGRAVYQQFCAACHGRNAEGDEAAALVGGRDSLSSERPRKTVESYWPYATSLWDYIRRSMPYESPGSLTDDEIYAVVAHLLHLGGIVGEDAVLDRETLPQVEMPNRDGFVPDDRPDTD